MQWGVRGEGCGSRGASGGEVRKDRERRRKKADCTQKAREPPMWGPERTGEKRREKVEESGPAAWNRSLGIS